jgi:hypothetical protein
MQDTINVDVYSGFDKEHAIISNPQPDLAASFQFFDVGRLALCVALDARENVFGIRAAGPPSYDDLNCLGRAAAQTVSRLQRDVESLFTAEP